MHGSITHTEKAAQENISSLVPAQKEKDDLHTLFVQHILVWVG
jgi:hypothetical protein